MPAMGDPVDPRPTLAGRDGAIELVGGRCRDCGYPLAFRRPGCPVCGGEVAEATFGPGGRIWSATVVRVATPDREPPYALAYVDLDDGPRVLAHLADVAVPPDVGTRVRLVPPTAHGDVRAEIPA